MRPSSAVPLAFALVALSMASGSSVQQALGQDIIRGPLANSYNGNDFLSAPGRYGMSYGFASHGIPRTYTVFSAYPGPSYGSNLPPYRILPGPYGSGLWRSAMVTPGYIYGATAYPNNGYAADSYSYRTFAVGGGAGYTGNILTLPPPVGVYAPALGPRTFYGW